MSPSSSSALSAPAGAELAPATGNVQPLELVMPRHVAAVVPFKDHEAYGKLTLDQKQRVSFLLQLFAEMRTAPDGLVRASERLAALHPGRGFSASNLRGLYYKFRAQGWRSLAKIYAKPNKKLPPEFIQEIRRRIEANSRSARAALVELKSDWARGDSIPGYGTWREYHAYRFPERDVPERYPFGFFPEGWSESNLYEQQSSKAERMLKRRGLAAAKRYLPHVARDLSGLRPLELIVIDDFEPDFMVQAWNPQTSRWQICRCTGLLAQDAATRRKLAIGLKPRFKDEEGAAMSITRADVQTLLYSVFSTHGLPTTYGCTLLCENASAAITADFELALELLLGVQVARTGLIFERTLANGFKQGGGKPWEKGTIESLFNLVHNAAASLPGQKGASYQLKPADLEAKVLYAEKVLNVEGLPADVVAQLRVPFLKFDDALTALGSIFQRIEERRDHRCDGFREIFHYRLPETAALLREDDPALALATTEQLLAAEVITLRESPVERWERLVAENKFQPVAAHLLACLLLTPKRITLRNHKLCFAHASQGYTYFDAESEIMRLPEGTDVLGYFDPARPQTLHVTDLKGHYLGAVRRHGYRVAINDPAAIAAESAAVSQLVRSLVAAVRQRHAGEEQQIATDDAHNTRLQLEHGVAEPVRHLPATSERPSAIRAHHSGESITPATGPGHDAAAARERATLPAKSVSARLAQQRPPQPGDDALPRGIAADVDRTAQRQARADALRDADELNPDEML